MSDEQQETSPAPEPSLDQETQGSVTAAAKARKADKPLPTMRIGLAKQFEIIRAYGALYVSENRAVKPAMVAPVVNMHVDTVRLTNNFFVDCGMLQKADAGAFIPHADVVSFFRAHQWNATNPEYKLQPVFGQAWFGKAIATRLSFRGAIDESEVIGMLAEAANAAPEHRPQLVMLIGFMETAGLLAREGNMVRAVKPDTALDRPVVPEQKPPADPKPQHESVIHQMRAVKLPKVNGTLTLSGDFNAFALSGPERKLVYDIIDLMITFEDSQNGVAQEN